MNEHFSNAMTNMIDKYRIMSYWLTLFLKGFLVGIRFMGVGKKYEQKLFKNCVVGEGGGSH